MKILFLSAASNIHTVRWVNVLADRGHEVYLVYNADHSPTIDKVNKKVIQHKLRFGGAFAYYLNGRELSKLSNKISPNIINAHYASGYGTLARIAKVRPLILSVWGTDVYDFPYKNKFTLNILRKNIDNADKIASTSYSMAKQVENIMRKSIGITITPFGVDTSLFKPMTRKKNNYHFTFGIVKTLSKNYGIEYILKAFKLLINRIEKENLDCSPILEIYGKGDLENELKTLCKKLSVSNQVFFRGYIPNTEVPGAINNMDVFCLGSEIESFGVAAVEAMACQIPVIATNASGFKEVIVDGVTGFIIPKHDEIAMADKMYELMINSKLRKIFGMNGRKRVIKFYDWEKNVDVMESLYNEVSYTTK